MISPQALDTARDHYHRFIASTHAGGVDYRLTPRAEPTPYARCFALFGLQLLGLTESLLDKSAMILAIRRDLDLMRDARVRAGAILSIDKPYLQLLSFSLSALAIVGALKDDPLERHVMPLLSHDVRGDLQRVGALDGVARSGNTAMFMAVLLLHARDYLGIDTLGRINEWCAAHLATVNARGFWGNNSTMSHLQFQNGYHQYEVLEYLHTPNVPWDAAAEAVASLADAEGHFAPYPGGGGCFDYDAVSILTGASPAAVSQHKELLGRTASTLLSEQNMDGGFAESLRIRPRNRANVTGLFKHAINASGEARKERLRQALTLLRPTHNRMRTHWSHYSREWGESDLWDSWFRMLAIARIQAALDPPSADSWGFINYPGIGFHPSVRN